MDGYSTGAESKPLTSEGVKIQRGEALKSYQGQVMVLKKELVILREETAEVLEERRVCLDELSASIKQLSEDYTQEARKNQAERNTLSEELQNIKDEIQSKINYRDSIQADFSVTEKALEEQEGKLISRERAVTTLEECNREEHEAVRVREEDVIKRENTVNDLISSFNVSQEGHERDVATDKVYAEKMTAYWNKAKQEVEQLRTESQKTLQAIQEAQTQLGISEESQLAFEQGEKDLEIKIKQNQTWYEILQQQEADQKLIDRILDKREKDVTQREKLYKQASQGGE